MSEEVPTTGRLAGTGIVDMIWAEEDNGLITAEGLQSYEIDADNDIAVFQGDKCVEVKSAQDLQHAVSMVWSMEAVCRWNIHMGKTWRGNPVNERGWTMPRPKKAG